MAKLEICTGDPQGVLDAIRGGADRIELCSGLAEGGLTPSVAMIRFAAARITTNVLIRPRGGDFVYTPDEIDVMAADVSAAIEAGAAGIVVGALTPDGGVDIAACRRLLEGAETLDNTFHRAFDRVARPLEALEDIIALGFRRILTSGQAPTAREGAKLISELRRRADGRIIIMAGAGVTPENAADIIECTGVDEIHASARTLRPSAATSTTGAAMGSADAADGSRMATDAALVSAIRQAIPT